MNGTEAIAGVATGALGVSDVVEDCLARVAELDPDIGAFRIVDETGARHRAKQLDHRVAGPLHGLVVGIKDVIDTAGLPTGYGSPLFAGHKPAEDADVVAALRRAGAVVLGKTESTEFAMFHPARTRNPADLSRTPGGSSSGSAAAVAAGMVPVALGTQTAGSVVRPAAYCGVYGFKPSWGWTPTTGIWRLSQRLDTVGLFARCVADLAAVYQVLRSPAGPAGPAGPLGPASPASFMGLMGPLGPIGPMGPVALLTLPGPTSPAGPGSTPPGPARPPSVAVLRAQEWAACEPDVGDALSFVAGRLSDHGWRVTEMALPAAWRHLPEQHGVVMAAEAARNLRGRLGDRVSQISEPAQAVVEQGETCLARDYLAALDGREEALAALAPLRAAADLILTPSALGAAPEGLASTGDPVMCRPWTLLGLPAANVPAWSRPDGLPVGVQFVGAGTDDLSYLTHLALVEAALTHKEDRT